MAKNKKKVKRNPKVTLTEQQIMAQERKAKQESQKQAIIMFTIGILLLAIEFIPGKGLWLWLKSLLFGLFGLSAVLLPLALIYISILIAFDKLEGNPKDKIWQIAVFILLISGLSEVLSVDSYAGINFWEKIQILYIGGSSYETGGIFSVVIGWPLLAMCGQTGAVIIMLLFLFAFFMILTNSTLVSFFLGVKKSAKTVGGIYSAVSDNQKTKKLDRIQKEKSEYNELLKQEQTNTANNTYVGYEDIGSDEGYVDDGYDNDSDYERELNQAQTQVIPQEQELVEELFPLYTQPQTQQTPLHTQPQPQQTPLHTQPQPQQTPLHTQPQPQQTPLHMQQQTQQAQQPQTHTQAQPQQAPPPYKPRPQNIQNSDNTSKIPRRTVEELLELERKRTAQNSKKYDDDVNKSIKHIEVVFAEEVESEDKEFEKLVKYSEIDEIEKSINIVNHVSEEEPEVEEEPVAPKAPYNQYLRNDLFEETEEVSEKSKDLGVPKPSPANKKQPVEEQKVEEIPKPTPKNQYIRTDLSNDLFEEETKVEEEVVEPIPKSANLRNDKTEEDYQDTVAPSISKPVQKNQYLRNDLTEEDYQDTVAPSIPKPVQKNQYLRNDLTEETKTKEEKVAKPVQKNQYLRNDLTEEDYQDTVQTNVTQTDKEQEKEVKSLELEELEIPRIKKVTEEPLYKVEEAEVPQFNSPNLVKESIQKIVVEEPTQATTPKQTPTKPSYNSSVAETVNDDYSTTLLEEEEEIYNDNKSNEFEENITQPIKKTNAYEDYMYYDYPPTSLLKRATSSSSGDTYEELQEIGDLLIDTLASFKVQATMLDINRGPSVTRYEIKPATGVKLSKIVGLGDDIALNLSASGVRVAAIPGKPAVGIEVPNVSTDVVTMREIIESDDFDMADSNVAIALGKDITGNNIIGDIATMPHMLIAGSTGSGKSVCINSIIMSILYKASPEDVRLLMIDPKVVELGIYNGIPHLLVPVVTDPRKAAGALAWAVKEMLKRYELFAENNVRDIKGYNQLEGEDITHMPQIIIIIDELADLMMAASKEVEDSICRLAQMARAAGMHLIIATQRPSVDVITGLIKANVPSRIAFAVSSQIDSRTILDTPGAEKLLGKGDMLFSPVGASKPVRVQCCFVSDDEINKVVSFIKSESKAHYDEKIVQEIESQAIPEKGAKNAGGGFDDSDELLDEAVELVVEAGKASTSFLQRKLRIGYARAAKIIDEMEDRNLVAPQEGSKPRQVLITKQQWYEMKLNSSN